MTDSADGLFTFRQQAAFWNDLYERPSSLFEHVMVKRRDYAWRYICSRFDTGARVLDLGCGAGVLSEKLIGSGFAVTAADASCDMLELARERMRHLPAPSLRLVNADCLRLPFAAGEFDVVACLGMFGYIADVSQALREIHRVLRPGGTLLISVRNAHTHRVFDLWQLAVLPARLVRALARRARARAAASAAATDDHGFRIRIYESPLRLIAGVTQRGYALTDFDGLGYGPLAFAERKLLPARVSVQISDFLEHVFRRTGLNVLSRWIADVSFYVFQRDS